MQALEAKSKEFTRKKKNLDDTKFSLFKGSLIWQHSFRDKSLSLCTYFCNSFISFIITMLSVNTGTFSRRCLECPFRAVIRRKQDSNRIQKSTNSFLLYRQHMDTVFSRMQIRMQYSKRIRSALISEILGFLWRFETAEVRGCYETLAELEKVLHFRRRPYQIYLPKVVHINLATFNGSQSSTENGCVTLDPDHHTTTQALIHSFNVFSS
jgi:hypothetical protein